MEKKYILTVVLTVIFTLNAKMACALDLPTVYNPGVMLTGLSDNGVYALSSTVADDNQGNTHSLGGVVIDLRTHEQTKVPAPSGWAEVKDVADNGVIVGSAAGKPGYWTPQTGEWTTFSAPWPWGGGAFTAVTPDARYAVGYYSSSQNEYEVTPMMYDLAAGQPIELTNLPTVDLSGQNQRQNALYGISPDGRYVMGQMSQSYLMPLSLITYIYDVQVQTWKPIGYDYDSATKKFSVRNPNLHFISNQFMSCDGNWVTGAAYVVKQGNTLDDEGFYPYRYNVATDQFDLYDALGDASVVGNKITADGVVLGASPADNPYPTAMIRYGKYFVSLDQIIQQVYGMNVSDLIHDSATGTFMALTADGRTAVMSTYDNSYVITVPEDFVTLASQVDLLGSYTLNIPNGAKINRISEIKLTFDRTVDCLNLPKNINLFDSAGNSVRAASGIAVSPTNDHTIVVTFRAQTLTPGETYTVDIPEGMIWMKDDASVKSKQIKITYVGRESGPIQMLNVSPADGVAVTQFNSNPDYLAVTFDTPVALSEEGRCGLYNADDDTFIADFSASVNGNTVYFFPTSTYALYKGSNYRVVISAGTVTDLSGGGGNEEIRLSYKGSYVRELSADDIYIFNAPCDTYDNFIFWSSESNAPGPKPVEWGFKADNTWMLLKGSEPSDNWALAAHSMFTPAGESDDWLITPQLYIPDANTYLAFDAQSYMRSKNDRLKVYVYADDAIYNYFSADLAEAFRTEGDLVFDEILSAGDTDEGLDGEWTRYTVPLEKYAGKNIYIAFVNNNYDQSAIFIDRVQVIRNMSFLITNQTPATVVAADDITVRGLLSIGTEITSFKGINLMLVDSEGTVISTIDDPNAGLLHGDVYPFAFEKKLPLTVGEVNNYKIEVSSGTEQMSFAFTVNDLLFSTNKKVVLEEYTGSLCGNCPLGIQAIEHLQRLYPDNFIAVTLRTYENDMYGEGLMDYTRYLGFTGAPTGRINRGQVLSPMIQNGSKGYEFFGRGITLSDGTEPYLWADAVQDALGVPAEAEVNFTSTFDSTTGSLTIPCTVRFALNRNDANIGVFAVVIEDNLPTFQYNYFNGVSDPNLGDWGVGGKYAQATVTTWAAMDVARFVVNGDSYNGTQLAESDFVAGREYDITLSATVPNGRLDAPENCKVAVMLIDRGTGAIINASEAKFGISGIEDIIDDNAPAEYYDLQGIKVDDPQHGHIYIKVQNGQASKIRY